MWIKMIQRCYDLESQRGMNKTYTECKVCEKWLCYEYFEQDYELLKQEIGFSEKDYRLDKDIISKGNKVYCFEKCCIVNHEINCLFIKADAIRGDFPIGVTKCENKYLARLSKKDEQGKNIRVRLGLFKTPEEAFIAYKSAKETYIKNVADDYFSKGLISTRIREAMYLWTVDIGD